MLRLVNSKTLSPFFRASRYFSQAQTQTVSINEVVGKVPDSKIAQHAPRGIYFDTGATTPMDFRVLDSMLPFMTNMFGNPHSKSHEYGWETEEAVDNARGQIASLINADPKEIIFTSGATESNNMALKGLAKFYKRKKHIITTQIEHKCVLDSCRHLEDEGLEVTYLPVKKDGLVDLNVLEAAIRPDTLAVSVIYIHNEIGVIQDLKAISKLCRSKGVFVHTDAAQAVGKIPLDVKDLDIDLMSISGHKLYGPKGIGALYKKGAKVRLAPLINGGGQERGMRSGTLSPALCVGFGKASELAQVEMKRDSEHIKKLYNKLLTGLQKIPHVYVNGSLESRYHGNLNISFEYIEGESLIMGIKTCAVSSGSACTSESLEPSYVLRALGVDDELAHTSIRFGIGRFTTEEEIDYLLHIMTKAVERLREMSPLWEMMQEGIDISKVQWTQPH